MPKDRIITAGVLNVRLHPNDSAIYLDFIESIFRLKKPIKIRGRRHAMISLIDKSKSKDGYVTGVITSLLDLSFDGGWFDANQAKEADDETISKIFIPEGIYADSFQFYFLFDLINHRITVQTQSGSNNFSIHSALLLFDKLGDNLSITKKFGPS